MSDRRTIATRASWKIHPCPDKRVSLSFAGTYGPIEFEKIKSGLIPLEMEDKWFMFFEEPWLYVHRSWTGFCIYGVRFEASPNGGTAVEAWASRDADQYRETGTEHDRSTLTSLIEVLLLGKPA